MDSATGRHFHASALDVTAAMRRGDDYFTTWAKVRMLADAQRELALALHAEVGRAIGEDGFTWEQVGDALGIPRETAFRQFNSGAGIVVARAHQAKRKPQPGGANRQEEK